MKASMSKKLPGPASKKLFRNLAYRLLVDILPSLFLLAAMAFAMATITR